MRLRDAIELCATRNGERCKDCILYGKKCEAVKRRHRVSKLYEIDKTKEIIQYKEERKHDEWPM